MGFLAPAALGLGALLGLVLLLHLLRPRQAERRVPSLLLWREILQDPPAARPWQPLRRSPLLLLQLLALGLLVLALARPWLASRAAVSGAHLILLVDRSATMAATDLKPSRLGEARRRALDLVLGQPGARVTLIAFDAHPELLAAGETDPQRIRAALEGLGPRALAGDATEALDFAAALAQGQGDTVAVLFSDGAFTLSGPPPAGLPLRFEPLGRSTENQAISALALTEAAADGGPRLYVQAANAGARPARRLLRVEVDGALRDARNLDLPPGGSAGFTLGLPPGAERVQAAFARADDLPLDDQAWAVRPRARPLQVLLLGAENRFLEAALGLLPGLGRLRRIDGGDTVAPGPALGPVDLAVLDGTLPPTLPDCPLLLLAPPGSLGPDGPDAVRPAGADLELPQPVLADAGQSLLGGGGFADAAILRARALELGSGWTPLVTAQARGATWPLLAEGRVNGRRALLLAFDLRDSDLPLLPAFPLFIAAAVEALAPRSLVELPPDIVPGEPLALRLAPALRAARIVDPAGMATALNLADGRAVFTGARLPGLYRVQAEGPDGPQETAFAVNLLGARPLDIRPRNPLAATAGAAASIDAAAPTAAPAPGRRELWRILAALALACLLAEWAYDHRRALAPRLAPPLRRWSRRARRVAFLGKG